MILFVGVGQYRPGGGHRCWRPHFRGFRSIKSAWVLPQAVFAFCDFPRRPDQSCGNPEVVEPLRKGSSPIDSGSLILDAEPCSGVHDTEVDVGA